MTKKIAYVGNFSFPHGNASGTRVLNNGYLLKELGYDVIFIGLDNTIPQNSNLKDTKSTFEGFTYYNLPYPAGMKGWISYRKRYEEVISLLKDENLHSVISYGSPSLSLFGRLLQKWCKHQNIFYLSDVVDWMGAGVGSLAYRTIKFLDNDYQKRILNSKSDGVITISSYLSDYYRGKGCKTVIIPPLVNSKRFQDLDFSFNPNDPIKLIYIGRPFLTDGRSIKESAYKDRLDIVIQALYEVKHHNFIFNIYGLTKDEYVSVISHHKDLLEELQHKIIFHGVIDNHLGIQEIAKADFTVLFRHRTRVTTAGFPTKFSETISCGTPIITTNTSDLATYLETGKNGFFVTLENQELLTKELNTLFSMTKKDILKMKEYCKDSQSFDYHNFKDKMKTFINSL